MDVLAYSAFNQQVALNQQIAAKNTCLATKCSETAAAQATAAGLTAAPICWLRCIEPCLLREPWRTSFYTCIPDLTGASSGFKVCRCAGSTQYNYGACCLWTVPGGVTRARFQIWGAGGGSGSMFCCGGSPFGATGAYASVIIPVTPGDTYTLCAGCAACCFPVRSSSGGSRLPGCPSYVIGTGLCNFCANGGQGRLGTWMASMGKYVTQRFSAPLCNYSGACICNSATSYCFSSCATCGQIGFSAGASYFGTTTSASAPNIVYGVRGMWPGICFDTNHYGHQCHPPIYGFTSTSQCTVSWTSTCCGYVYRASQGYLQIPGAGGWFTTAFGGNYGVCGDIGRFGMVCVSYC